MPTALIVDDEPNGAESLGILVTEHCPDLKLKLVESDPLKALSFIKKNKPDILFLDIEMPGMNGFELLSELEEPLPKVIFTTAYNQYAVQAFRHNAIDYLLKPIIVSELLGAVNKAKERLKLNSSLSNNNAGSLSGEKITVQCQNEIVTLNTDQIIRLEADSNYTNIYLVGGKKIISAKTLKEYEEQLGEGDFFRIHKTNLINTKHVERYIRGEKPQLIMKDNSCVDISRRKKTDFLAHFYKGRV